MITVVFSAQLTTLKITVNSARVRLNKQNKTECSAKQQFRSCFIDSCHVGVSKRFSRNISLAVCCLCTFFLWLITSLVDPILAAFIICGPLQLVIHQRRKNLGSRLQLPESFTLPKATLKSTRSFTGHQLHLSQLLLEIVKKYGVCRLSVLVPSHFLQQALGPSPHSEDVCQSTR